MRTLILTLVALTLLGCEYKTEGAAEDSRLRHLSCRAVYLGNCPHILCYYDRGISMVTQDPTCRPQNAVVSSIPSVAPPKVVP